MSTTVQITANTITPSDRLTLAGAPFVVTARVHGDCELDYPHARFVEFELAPIRVMAANDRSMLRLPKDTQVDIERIVSSDDADDAAPRLPLYLPRFSRPHDILTAVNRRDRTTMRKHDPRSRRGDQP